MSYSGNRLLIGSCVILVLALALASRVGSQEPAPITPDLGETNLVTLTCNLARDAIESNGGRFKQCRRSSPDIINGNSAIITVAIVYDYTKVKVQFRFRKTLWMNTGAKEVG